MGGVLWTRDETEAEEGEREEVAEERDGEDYDEARAEAEAAFERAVELAAPAAGGIVDAETAEALRSADWPASGRGTALVLIGGRGCGKSSISRRIAASEKRFERLSTDYLMRYEADGKYEVARKCCALDEWTLLDCGGGIVVDVAAGEGGDELSATSSFAEIMARRDPWYRATADVTLQCAGMKKDEIAKAVMACYTLATGVELAPFVPKAANGDVINKPGGFFSEGLKESGGVLYNETHVAGVNRKAESWEAIYWGTMATCLAVLVVGGNMKPDTSIITWARQEAERREQA
eukprot:PRCOL_00006944-RA